MRRILVALMLAVLATTAGFGLQKTDLSPEARALIPDSDVLVLTLKDGTKVEGQLVMDRPEDITLKVQRTATIASNRTVPRSEITAIETLDATPLLAAKLKELKLDPERSQTEKDYARPIALLEEFMQKCKGSPDMDAIRVIHLSFTTELKQVQSGMKRVKAQWLSPITGILQDFTDCTARMKELKGDPKFSGDPKMQEEYKEKEEQRKAAARALPKMMQDRIPSLVADKKFDDAVSDVTGFLQFWLVQVMSKEGLHESFAAMDFDYIVRMQNGIMEAYRKTGAGEDKGPSKVDSGMVYVPGGYFLMGRADAKPGDSDFPMHIVFVSPFLIDKFEVTNKDYKKFVDTVKSTGLATMEHPDAPPMKKHDAQGWGAPGLSGDDQPVVGIDWFDAYAYANWVGKRLPTEAEWEFAARGMDGRIYPWGDKAPDTLALNWSGGRNFIAREMDRMNPPKPREVEASGCSCVKPEPLPPVPTSLPSKTWNVDSMLPAETLAAMRSGLIEWKPGDPVSAYGICHMAGNAAEWVNDFFDPNYYGKSEIRDPQGPETGTKGHVYRGGSYITDNKQELTTYMRGMGQNAVNGVSGGKSFIGFRCAKWLGTFKPPTLVKPPVVATPTASKPAPGPAKPSVPQPQQPVAEQPGRVIPAPQPAQVNQPAQTKPSSTLKPITMKVPERKPAKK